MRPEWSSGTTSVEHVKPGAFGHGCEPVRRGAGAGGRGLRGLAVDRGVVGAWRRPCPRPPHAAIATATAMTAARRIGAQSRIAGNSTTSRIVRLPVSSITSRSMPMPIPPVGRQAVLERLQVGLVEGHGLLVALVGEAPLGLEARALLVGVVELGERVGELHPAREGLEALDEARARERWSLASGEISLG